MRLSATGNNFRLQGTLRAWDGANEVCRRDWDRFHSSRFLMIDRPRAITREPPNIIGLSYDKRYQQ